MFRPDPGWASGPLEVQAAHAGRHLLFVVKVQTETTGHLGARVKVLQNLLGILLHAWLVVRIDPGFLSPLI